MRNDVAPDIPAIPVSRGYRAPKGMDLDDVFTKIDQAGLKLVEIQ
jgi:stage V sporulation protein SpoVS